MRLFLTSLLLLSIATAQAERQPLRFALNDLPGKGMLPILVGVEHARAAGVAVELRFLNSENIVIQAVNNDLADLGMGTPYQHVQQTGSPLRMIYQLSKLAFRPVVNTQFYSDWKGLDGAVMYAHGPGSGTEAVLNILARQHGISYREMRYLPGSGTRARAMLEGRIKATVVDLERSRLLLSRGNGRFAQLPLGDTAATDEAIFASTALIRERRDDVKVLLASMLKVWRLTNTSPDWLLSERERLGLLPRLESGEAEEIPPFIQAMVAADAYPRDGGLADAVSEDFAFYSASGTLRGGVHSLREGDFWDFSMLREIVSSQSAD